MSSADRAQGGGKTLLLVAGSGRSGTSLCAGLVHQLGMHIPQPEVAANDTNPRGFGEPRWSVDFHQQLLRSVGVRAEDARPAAWDVTSRLDGSAGAGRRLQHWLEGEFASSPRIVIKDPRITWFIPLYQAVGARVGVQPRVLTMLRHPAASVRSRQLAYGQGSSDTHRLVGWLNMMLFLEHRTRGLPRALVAYDALLTDWRSALLDAEHGLGTDLVSGSRAEQQQDADALVDPALRRAPETWSGLDVPDELRDAADTTHQALASGATEELDRLREWYTAYYATAESVARSSIAAARTAERRKLKREQHEAAPAPAVPGGPARSFVGALVRRVRA